MQATDSACDGSGRHCRCHSPSGGSCYLNSMFLANLVAQSLRTLRLQRKLSQETVAARARVSVSYVTMLERGQRTPPLDPLEALARAQSVSPLDLLQKLPMKRGRG